MFTIIGALDVKRQTCLSGITSALTEHKSATMYSGRSPRQSKIYPAVPGYAFFWPWQVGEFPASAERPKSSPLHVGF